MKKMLLLMSMMLMTSMLFAQTTFYVKTDGDDTKDGTSWANAKASIADMVANIADPANSQIFVKKGTYTLTSSITLTGAKSGLKLYGGFNGTEDCLCDRVFGTTSADSTVLDGNNSVRVINNSGAIGNKITEVVWDGFTITKGIGSGGAGMTSSYADVTIRNCIFKGNESTTTSGAMYNSQNNIVIEDCKFYANKATSNGGAIIFSTKGSATVTNCTFDGNMATGNGGAIVTYATNADRNTINITNSTFTRNTAGGNGGAFTTNAYTTIVVDNCTFSGNTATVNGGGIHNNGNSTSTITNSTFTGNVATTNGGGMYYAASAAGTITNTTFISNEAQNTTTGNGGGGIFCTEANPVLTNCTFLGNKAKNSGGAMALGSTATIKFVNCLFAGNKADNAGGAAYITNATGKISTPTFINCTIAGNYAPTTGGGIYNTGNSSTNTVITNCIVYDNNSGITNSASAGATATVTYSNVQYTNAVANPNYPEGDYSAGTGNINATPFFINSPASTSAPFTSGNYQLYGGPTINAGLNTAINDYSTDLANNPRVYNVTVDMGAYEYQSILPVTISSFTAKLVNNRTQLKWSVGTENNVNRYEVQRSQNGIDFVKVATINANNSSNYGTADNNPSLGVNYYRLVTVDNDGTTAVYQAVQTITIVSLAEQSVQVSPNPVKGNKINLTLNGYASGIYSYKLVNTAGTIVQQGNVNNDGSTISIATAVPVGLYVLYLSNGSNEIKTRLVKQ